MPVVELTEPVHGRLESEAKRRGLSPSDTIGYLPKGIVPPRVGNGTYEDIKRFVETLEGTDEPDGFIEAIEENRAMRRQLAQEKED